MHARSIMSMYVSVLWVCMCVHLWLCTPRDAWFSFIDERIASLSVCFLRCFIASARLFLLMEVGLCWGLSVCVYLGYECLLASVLVVISFGMFVVFCVVLCCVVLRCAVLCCVIRRCVRFWLKRLVFDVDPRYVLLFLWISCSRVAFVVV